MSQLMEDDQGAKRNRKGQQGEKHRDRDLENLKASAAGHQASPRLPAKRRASESSASTSSRLLSVTDACRACHSREASITRGIQV